MMYDYIEGLLCEGDKVRFEAHISECENCRAELEMRQEILPLSRLAKYEAPHELRASVMNRIEAVPQESKFKSFMVKFAPVGTVAAAAAFMLLAVSQVLISGVISNKADSGAGEETIMYKAQLYGVPAKENHEADTSLYMKSAEIYADASEGNGEAKADAEKMESFSVASAVTASPLYRTEAYVNKQQDAVMQDSRYTYAIYSRLELVFGTLTQADGAVIVCYEDDATWISDDQAGHNGNVFGDVSYTCYEISKSDAVVSFAACLRELEDNGAEYMWSAPEGELASFSIYAVERPLS